MKFTTITAATIALAVSFAAPSPAEASQHNWQYAPPTSASLTVEYPSWVNMNNANHVNVRLANADTGQTRTLNWHWGTRTPGRSRTVVFAEHGSWPGWDRTCVVWVQVAETNYHWSGSVCDDPLPPVTLPPVTIPPVTTPPVTTPPVTVPPVTVPPTTLPPVVTVPPTTVPPLPPVTVPPVTFPPLVIPPVTLPPVTLPPVTTPPVTLPPVTTTPPVDGCFITDTRTWLLEGSYEVPGDHTGTTRFHITPCGLPVVLPPPAVPPVTTTPPVFEDTLGKCFITEGRYWLPFGQFEAPAPTAPTIDVGPLVEPAV